METVIIIGGGPAGCSAALWLANYGLRPILIETADRLGGLQARSPYPNTWMLGQIGVLSKDLAAAMERHVRLSAVQIALHHRVVAVDPAAEAEAAGRFAVTCTSPSGDSTLDAAYVVLACGTGFRGRADIAAVSGYAEVADLIAHDPIEAHAVSLMDGPRVAVIGGGDNAFEAAAGYADGGQQVDVLVRSTIRAQTQFRRRLDVWAEQGRVRIHQGVSVTAMRRAADGTGRAAVALSVTMGEALTVNRLVVMMGYHPAQGAIRFDPAVAPRLNADGYMHCDGDGLTSVPGLYVAGDVANPRHPCVATAIAAGTVAARSIQEQILRQRQDGLRLA